MSGSDRRASWITSSPTRYLVAGLLLVFSSIYYGAEIGIIHTITFLVMDFTFSHLGHRRGDNRISFFGRIFAILIALGLPTLLLMALSIFSGSTCKDGIACPASIEIRRATQ